MRARGAQHWTRLHPERIPRGEARVKLTEAAVREILELYATGQYVMRELGEKFHVTKAQICQVLHRDRWAHVR